jgi:hypothetical protein
LLYLFVGYVGASAKVEGVFLVAAAHSPIQKNSRCATCRRKQQYQHRAPKADAYEQHGKHNAHQCEDNSISIAFYECPDSGKK